MFLNGKNVLNIIKEPMINFVQRDLNYIYVMYIDPHWIVQVN